LQAADASAWSPGDGGGLVIGEDDGVLGTDAAARRAALLAAVLVFDQDAVLLVHAINAEQAKIDALHAIGATAVIDDGVPARLRLLKQLLGGESRGRNSRGRVGPQVQAEFHECRLRCRLLGALRFASLPALLGDAAHFIDVRLVAVEIAQVE